MTGPSSELHLDGVRVGARDVVFGAAEVVLGARELVLLLIFGGQIVGNTYACLRSAFSGG